MFCSLPLGGLGVLGGDDLVHNQAYEEVSEQHNSSRRNLVLGQVLLRKPQVSLRRYPAIPPVNYSQPHALLQVATQDLQGA
ncbi:MAG: hypothetical protein RLZZ453_594 [Chlamydiota bacterium]